MDEDFAERLDRLRQEQAKRRLALIDLERQRLCFLRQLEKFNLCNCIAMGRYSTCCRAFENVQDGFFHLPRAWKPDRL